MSQLHRIALSMLRCLSPQNARLLLEEVKTAESVFDLEVLKEIPGLNPRLPEEVATGAALRQAERELDFMANSGVSLHWFGGRKLSRPFAHLPGCSLVALQYGRSRIESLQNTFDSGVPAR